MALKNFEFIQGKIVPRPWGTEYRFSAKDPDGRIWNEIVMLPDEKADEKTIQGLIQAHLDRVSVKMSDDIPLIINIDDQAVEKYLIEHAYIEPNQTLSDVKTALAKEATIEAVK